MSQDLKTNIAKIENIRKVANLTQTSSYKIIDENRNLVFTPSRQLRRLLERNKLKNIGNRSRPASRRGIKTARLLQSKPSSPANC